MVALRGDPDQEPGQGTLARQFIDQSHRIVQRSAQAFDEEDEGGGLHADEVGGSSLSQVALGDVEAGELRSAETGSCPVGWVVVEVHVVLPGSVG